MLSKLSTLFVLGSAVGLGAFGVSQQSEPPAKPRAERPAPAIVAQAATSPAPTVTTPAVPAPTAPRFALTAFQGGPLVGPDTLYVRAEWSILGMAPPQNQMVVQVNRIPGANAWISPSGVRILGGLYQGYFMVGRSMKRVSGTDMFVPMWVFAVDASGNAPVFKPLDGSDSPVNVASEWSVAADGLAQVTVTESP